MADQGYDDFDRMSSEDYHKNKFQFRPSGANPRERTFESSQVEWIDDIPNRIRDVPENVVRDVNDWHMPMLNDSQRNEAYAAAIEKIVNEDSTVLEIGCGSGIMSLLAAKSGAKKVYAIEASEDFVQIATTNICVNGYEDKIQILPAMSTDVYVENDRVSQHKKRRLLKECILPERCNVLVAEILGTMLDGESCIHYYEDARKRLLTPNAKIIPAFGRQYCSLITGTQLKSITQPCNFRGLDLGSFNRFRDSVSLVFSKNYGVILNNLDLVELTEPMLLYECNFTSQGLSEMPLGGKRTISAEVLKSGEALAIMYWWEVFMDEEQTISISTHPDRTRGNVPRDLNWGQALTLVEHPDGWNKAFPMPCNLVAGDRVTLEFTSEEQNAALFQAKVVDTGRPHNPE